MAMKEPVYTYRRIKLRCYGCYDTYYRVYRDGELIDSFLRFENAKKLYPTLRRGSSRVEF